METIGRYEILGELGRGGCGVVYRALDPGIGRTVAIKTIRVDSEAADLRERFRREARSAGILSHPNIVTIHEFNDSGDVMFIAMEYIEGKTLGQRMREGLLPIDFTVTTITAAADALDYAHAHGIVHRDVKPANFLITQLGHVKMADFGIAKLLDSDDGLTSTGMVIGTAQYMSPEQIAAKDITGKSDQFSLGVIAYEMLTGKRPFQGNSWASMMHAIIASDPIPLNEHRKELGDSVTEVLRKALAKDPLDRFETCKAFAVALERSIQASNGEHTVWHAAGRAAVNPESMETVVLPTSKPSTGTAQRPTVVPDPTATVTVATAKLALPTSTLPTSASPITTTREIPSPGAPRRSWTAPAGIGAVVVIGLAAWFGFRNNHPQDIAQPTVAPPSVATQDGRTPTAAETVSSTASSRSLPQQATQSIPASTSTAPDFRSRSSNASAPVASAVTSPPPSPAAIPARAAALPAVQPPLSVPTTTPVTSTPPAAPAPAPAQQAPVPKAPEAASQIPVVAASPAPAPVLAAATPSPAPARTIDPAEAAAQRHAAELAATRKMITDAVNRYRQAFEARDLDGVKASWPTLGRNEQNSFQNFFRIARSVKLQLTPLGEPEMTASGAVTRYRRSMTATDDRGALPAQDQTVKITLRRTGEQMVIDAIEAVGR